MLMIRTTPHLYGITLAGDYEDLNELYDSISRYLDFYQTNAETWPYHEYEYMLSLNYDIRHAWMGSRNAEIIENNADSFPDDPSHIRKKCAHGNLYFSVEILYPLVFHYLNVLDTILDEYLLPAAHTKKPDFMEEYSALQANHDRAQIRLFTSLLWKNLQELFGEIPEIPDTDKQEPSKGASSGEKYADLFYRYFESSYRQLSPSIYINALLHCQMSWFPRMENDARKSFLLLSFLEISGFHARRTRSAEYAPVKTAAKEAEGLLKSAGFIHPSQNKFFMKLEKSLPAGEPLYRSAFDSFLDSCYGAVPEECEEPDW